MEANKIFGPIDAAISGMQAQGKNIKAISSNVANIRTTDAGEGKPYQRLEPVFRADDETGGVILEEIVPDTSDFLKILDPGNPKADDEGYVLMPNVNLPTEMINLTVATRSYQANAAVLKRYQNMVETTLELLR